MRPLTLFLKFVGRVQTAVLLMGSCVVASAQSGTNGPVTILQTETAYVLANGIVTARIDKRNGDLVSLQYRTQELLGAGSGHPYGYWSHTPTRGAKVENAITIDPHQNGGARAEVAVKGVYQGAALGQGPGGSVAADIEIRYTLERGEPGLYTYSIFDHKANYPATAIGEARFGAKLNDKIFDYMAVDEKRRKIMITAEDWDRGAPLNMKEARRMTTGRYAGQAEHKYDYSILQFDEPVFGWASTQARVGLWCINPTIEYLSGGPTKVELSAHRDVNFGASPTILNYWRGSHYGGSECSIEAGETWSKVIGPFLLYCNTGPDGEAMWRDARARFPKEAACWPYDWVQGVDYPHRDQRAIARGRVILNDPEISQQTLVNLRVGLTPPEYGRRPSRRSAGQTVEWQRDAKGYQFWVKADRNGAFVIPNVRPGAYALHAIADNVLGEFEKSEVQVASGQKLDLGRLEWKPVRYGKQLWEIGVPDRTAAEFRHGDHYWQWGLYNEYAKEFPQDVNFVIGTSDIRKDWNYAQVPHTDGTPTTWTVRFNLPAAAKGKATLRLAFAATSARNVAVAVNGQSAGDTGPLMDTAVIRRDGIRGYWTEYDIPFDAGLLKAGENKLQLTIPPGGVMSGVEYDYLRLELASTP